MWSPKVLRANIFSLCRSCQPSGLTFPGKKELLCQPRGWAKVDASKVSDLSRFPTFESVTSRHRLNNPYVHRKCFQAPRAKEEHAIGHLLPNSRQAAEPFLGLRVGQGCRFLEPTGMRSEKKRRLMNIARTKTKQTFA